MRRAGGDDGGAVDGKRQGEAGVVVGVLADQVYPARRPPQTLRPAADEVREALSRHPGREWASGPRLSAVCHAVCQVRPATLSRGVLVSAR